MEEETIDNEIEIENWWESVSETVFKELFRMSSKSFTVLQEEINAFNNISNSEVDKNLLAILWILGNTVDIVEAVNLFQLENFVETLHTTLHNIIRLAEVYVLWPTLEEAEEIEKSFLAEYKFPAVVGAIASLHISVKVDNVNQQNIYYNPDTQQHTIVCQFVCDNNLLLRDVCVGCPGGKSVSEILKLSPLYDILTDEDHYLNKTEKCLFGGTNHPALATLLTPYTDTKLTEDQIKFNDTHSLIMSIIDKTVFHIERRFPRISAIEDLNPSLSGLLVSACCVLYNYTNIKDDWIEEFYE